MTKPTLARELTFSTLDDILDEARRIAAQPQVTTRGNWSASQNIWHVARYIQASVEGYPFNPPWYLKLIGPLFKKRMTRKTMSPGYKTSTNMAEHMEPQSVSEEQTAMGPAIEKLEQWVGRASDQGFIPANPVFGKMSTQQWVDLHCRHAELHFGLIERKD
jgi:hypothetical protein